LYTPKSAAGIRAITIPSIIAVYLRFKAFSAGANIPTLKGFERGYGSFIAHLEALCGCTTKRTTKQR
jgi:hypothetical protein